MLTIILLAIAFIGSLYAYIVPTAPLHEFLHPAHITTGNFVGQALFGVAVCGICVGIGKMFN